MKILVLHHTSTLGGGTLSLIDVTRMLAQEFDVTVCAPGEPVWLGERVRQSGATFLPSRLAMPVFYHYNGMAGFVVRMSLLARGLRQYKRLRRSWVDEIERLAPDVVIVNSAVLCLFGPIIAAAGATPVCLVRETFPSRRRSVVTTLLYYVLRRWFALAVYLSDFDRRASGAKDSSAVVVPDCLPPGSMYRVERASACEQIGVRRDTVNVLYVGGATHLKGFDTLLEAASALPEERIQVLVAGSEPEWPASALRRLQGWLANPVEQRFRRRVGKLRAGGADRVVTYLGSSQDMSVVYSASDLVVFPSTLPHQARPVVEAGFHELPVVISDFSCTAEYVQNGVNGVCVAPRDPISLRKAIELLSRDDGLRARLGKQNANEFEKVRNYEQIGRRLTSAIRDLSVSRDSA